MTENTGPVPGAAYAPPPTSTPPPPRPPLRRSRNDRMIGGVAGGIAHWLGIDPVIVRVVLVVLAVFGGSGLVLYAIGWLFIPDEGVRQSEAQKLFENSGGPGSAGRIAFAIVAVGLGIILLGSLAAAVSWNGMWGFGGGGAVLLLAAAAGVVLWLAKQGDGAPMAPSLVHETTAAPATQADTTVIYPATEAAVATSSAVVDTTAHGTTVDGTNVDGTTVHDTTGYAYGGYGDYPGYVAPVQAPPAPRPRRARSYLGAATLSLALVVMGVLASLRLSGAATVPVVVVLAAGLGVLGLGLVVGTFAGRARWLIALALPLLLVTAIAAFFPANVHFGGGIGERTWTPATPIAAAANHRLGFGTATLDLSDLVLPSGSTANYPVRASVGVGELLVTAPAGMRVNVIGTVGTGEIGIEGLPRKNGQNVRVSTELPGAVPESAPTVDLIVDVTIGSLEVSRA